jgi:hypothetical protein
MAALAERRPVRLLRPAPPEMGRQSQRFVLEFPDEAGHDKFVKTNEEMLHVKALIALLLAEKTQLLLRIERAAAVIAGAAVRRWTTVVLESSGRDCAQKRVKLMSNIEHIEVLVETIRARIDTLKSDPDPDSRRRDACGS